MSARILVLPFDKLRNAAAAQSAEAAAGTGKSNPSHVSAAAERLQFWRGASGRAYPYTVYSLAECPPLPAAGYVLVRRDARGRGEAVAIGRVTQSPGARNLSALRRLGACLGADEVHVLFPTSPATDLGAVERDLTASGLAAPAHAPLNVQSAAGTA